MPWRATTCEQAWLMPPSADELLPEEHPTRAATAFVDALLAEDWTKIGVRIEAQRTVWPAWYPRPPLGIWLYGFAGTCSPRRSWNQPAANRCPTPE